MEGGSRVNGGWFAYQWVEVHMRLGEWFTCEGENAGTITWMFMVDHGRAGEQSHVTE
jgi:hypothetical protein